MRYIILLMLLISTSFADTARTGLYLKSRTCTSSCTATSTDTLIYADATAGNMTVTLPSASLNPEKVIEVIKKDTTSYTVRVQGAVSYLNVYSGNTFISTGSVWKATNVAVASGKQWVFNSFQTTITSTSYISFSDSNLSTSFSSYGAASDGASASSFDFTYQNMPAGQYYAFARIYRWVQSASGLVQCSVILTDGTNNIQDMLNASGGVTNGIVNREYMGGTLPIYASTATRTFTFKVKRDSGSYECGISMAYGVAGNIVAEIGVIPLYTYINL